jgi:DNA-binding Lrp family transcriptional regulator
VALPIINAIRTRRDLKQSLKDTGEELAHLASFYGVARVALTFLAVKCHCCKQTVINHLKKLEERGIIRKRKTQVKGSALCETNTYTFIIPWKKTTAQTCNSQKIGRTLPTQEGREKNGSVREEIAQLTKGLRYLDMTPGSLVYTATMERLAYLEGLLQPPGRDEAARVG